MSDEVQRVTLPQVASYVEPWFGRAIDMCGLVQAEQAQPGERFLHAKSSSGEPYWFLVYDPEYRLPLDKTVCVKGLVRVRPGTVGDGGRVADGLQNPAHVLYPLDCTKP